MMADAEDAGDAEDAEDVDEREGEYRKCFVKMMRILLRMGDEGH